MYLTRMDVQRKLEYERFLCVMCGLTVGDRDVVLPEGSEFEGRRLCSDCIKEIIDPIIGRLGRGNAFMFTDS